MKLSMWMIANRLNSLDMDLNIREDAPVVLKSARRAYATNCVHVFQAENDVVCNGEGDYIRIKDMKINQAFEIIQSVFDFYEDWYNALLDTIEAKDYQKVIDTSWPVFHNPLLLLDGNCKVLAMSNQYTADALDSEWQYLSTYGYSSINAVRFIKFEYRERDFSSPSIQKYRFNRGNLKMGGYCAGIYFRDTLCGQINLLEHERSLNSGDQQLLSLIIKHLTPALGQIFPDRSNPSSNNVFYDLIEGRTINEELLSVQMSYLNWKADDSYQIAVLTAKENIYSRDLLAMAGSVIRNSVPSCYNIILDNNIIVISNESVVSRERLLSALDPLIIQNGLKLALSLPLCGINQISFLYKQALASFEYGKLYDIEHTVYDFYDYAIDYIIESPCIESALDACHPDVMMLWNKQSDLGSDTVHTFHTYLNHERSIVHTAQALYVHRNTIVYRIKKITEMLHYDLEDTYTRDYMKLSLKVLHLYIRKYHPESGDY